jgi:hypothetical protein
MSAIGAYSRRQNFTNVLQDVHDAMKAKMIKNTLAAEAQELQSILQTIKKTAINLSKDGDYVTNELAKQYTEFLEGVMAVQNKNRKRNFTSATRLFRRRSKTTTSANADNIFEDELAALFAYVAGEEDTTRFLTGNIGADTESVMGLTKEIENDIIKRINKVSKQLESKYRAKGLFTGRSQKIDNKGYSENVTIGVKLDNVDLQRLAVLLKDATFTAKQYTSYNKNGKDTPLSEIGLKLGQTNIYKAITGSLSSIYSNVKDQQQIFFRGLTILGYKNKTHSATPEFVGMHFTHLRFIYELRGEGLLDEQGNSAIAKYIIYNDPNSDAIFVRDTASIIIKELERKNSNIFGAIYLSASKVNSN